MTSEKLAFVALVRRGFDQRPSPARFTVLESVRTARRVLATGKSALTADMGSLLATIDHEALAEALAHYERIEGISYDDTLRRLREIATGRDHARVTSELAALPMTTGLACAIVIIATAVMCEQPKLVLSELN